MNVCKQIPDAEFHILAVRSFDDVSTKLSSDENVAPFKTSVCPLKVSKHIPAAVLQIFTLPASDDVRITIALELKMVVTMPSL